MAVEIYSTDTDSGQISVVRKEESGYRLVKAIPVGNAPRGGVKFTGDGRGFVSNTSMNTVSEIDALSHREVARIVVGFGPRGLAIVADERYLLVSNSGSNTVSVVDLESREELTQVAVGRDPRHMGVDPSGKFAYVCIWGSGYIAKLDISGLASGDAGSVREVGRIRIEPHAHPYSLNVDRAGRYALVACNSVEYVPVIELASGEVIARVPVRAGGGRAVAFTPDNRFALVTLERDNSAAVIRMSDFTVTRYLPVGPAPRGIAIDEDDERAYISAFSRSTVWPGNEDHDFQAHAVTVMELRGVDLESTEQMPRYDDIRVGYGPCSVVVFDTERASYHATKVDAAVRDLVAPAAAAG
jgi:YVTN family beta-propeller protein